MIYLPPLPHCGRGNEGERLINHEKRIEGERSKDLLLLIIITV
jgi:hypothetical protein